MIIVNNYPGCSSPNADVVFVLDGSGSITSRNFRTVKSFVQNVVEAFDVSNKTVRIGLIEFSRSAEVQFDLQQYSNKEDVKRAVGLIPYFGRGKQTCIVQLKDTHTCDIIGLQNLKRPVGRIGGDEVKP